MPKILEAGVLYVSREYRTSAHMCPCGCGSKIRTPLGPTEWKLLEGANGPTLSPSIGNWQKPCRSHYLIEDGQTVWCRDWSTDQIAAGRVDEQNRREEFYKNQKSRRSLADRLQAWISQFLVNNR